MSKKRKITLLFGLIAVLGIFFCAGFYGWILNGLPGLNTLPAQLNNPSVRITDRNGRLLYEVLPKDGGRHAVIPMDQIPAALKQATIATEDGNFYQNPGIDISGIARSIWIDLKSGSQLAGGSTITQQVARNLLLDSGERAQRSLRRKIREGVLAWELTRNYTKEQILGLYLNQTYYGDLSYGVDAAARTYFGKPVNELDLAECALLAGLPQSPASFDPYTHLSASKTRQKIVLGLMVKQKMISVSQADQAAEEPLVINPAPYPIEAPHFVMWIKNQLDDLFTQDDIYAHGGLIVRTSLNLDDQHLAEQAIDHQMTKLNQNLDNPLGYNLNNAALVALDPENGQVLAMVGSPDYFDSNHAGAINMAMSPRQPGSALKPLIYATAFDPTHPQPFTPATMLLDVATHYVTHDGLSYTPVNYDSLEHGPVLARTALASSLNIPAVQTLKSIGLPALFKTSKSLGITSFGDPDRYDLSLALGGGEVSLLELTGAYGALANDGYRVFPTPILDVTDPQGNTLFKATAIAKIQALDPRVAWLISDILSDDDARVVGFGRNSVLNLGRPAAVKTGTTTDFHDNWTIGYTPDLVVGVWAGNANHEAMRNINGLTGAAPVWAQFMRSVTEGQPEKSFTRPDGLVKVQICSLSGMLPSPTCPYTRAEWFIEGTQPLLPDTLYHQVIIDQATGQLADPSTSPQSKTTRLALDLPIQAQAWARRNHVLLLSDLNLRSDPQAGASKSGSTPNSPAPLSFVSPAPESIYKFSETQDAKSQALRLAADGEAGLGPVSFFVDGNLISTVPAPPYETWWPLSVGTHEAWVSATRSDGVEVSSLHVRFYIK